MASLLMLDIILPVTAFSHMDLSLRTLDVVSPVVEIAHKKEDYFVNALYRTDDDRFVDKVYSFANQ